MSGRAVLIAVVGIVAICWVVSAAELTYLQSGFLQLPPAALVMLILLLGFRRFAGRRGLTLHETAILYCLFLLAALVASRGLMEKLLPALIAPHYFAQPPNRWAEEFFPYLPPWAVAFDPAGPAVQPVSRAYYEGLRVGQSLPWTLWIRPLAAWSLLVGMMFGAFLCMAALLRRPWVEHERLAFPLAQLPLELMQGGEGMPLGRQPLLWLGFALPAFVYSLNSLQAWYPALPSLPLASPALNTFLTSPPWNQLPWTPAFVSFAEVGLLYFVPLDLLFSLWFFFLFTRVQEGVLTGFGYEPRSMSLFPCRSFVGYQVAGAYFVLALGLLRAALPYWKQALRGALQPAETAREPIPPRTALVSLIVCLLGMTFWSRALGLSFGWALAQWVIYLFVVCLVMGRSVAEGGLIMTETSFRPSDLYALAAPMHTLGPNNLTGMAMLDAVWYRDQRGIVFSGLLDALKIGGAQRIRLRALLLACCLALGLATVCSAVAQLWLPYHLGALHFYPYLAQANPIWGFEYYAPHLHSPAPYEWPAPVFFTLGVVVTLALIQLRTRYLGWPLLPLGYALSGSWTMILLWFPCLFTWLVKGLILRYGGRRIYQRLRPFFLGLILGEFCMFVVWTLASALVGVSPPAFMWP
jgi:hypothetical protein